MWQSIGEIIKLMDEVRNCESPIERTMAVSLYRCLAPGINVKLQHGIETLCGEFRLDMVLRQGNRLIGIECDGKDFHDLERDQWRDALILATGQIESISRFTGSEIYNLGIHCLYDLALVYPQLFQPKILHQYWPSLDPSHCVVNRRARFGINRLGQRCFGKDLYQFAHRHGGTDLDVIINAFHEHQALEAARHKEQEPAMQEERNDDEWMEILFPGYEPC